MNRLLAILVLLSPVLGFGAAFDDAITSYYKSYTGIEGVNPLATNSIWIYHPDHGSETFNYGDGAVPYRTNIYGPYTHWIDPTNSLSADGTNTWGGAAKPRLTVPYPLPPGSVVQLHSRYQFAPNGAPGSGFSIGGDGTSKPIFFTGIVAPKWGRSTNDSIICTNETEMIVMTGPSISTALYPWGTNIYIQNILFTNDVQINLRPLLFTHPVEKIVVRNVRGKGTGTGSNPTFFSGGGSSGASAANYTTNTLFIRSEVTGYGRRFHPTESDGCGFIMSQYAYKFEGTELNLWDLGGDGWRIGADQGDSASGSEYTIAGGWFHDNRENGGDIKQVREAKITGNSIFNITTSSTSNGEGIVAHYIPENIFLFNNSYSNCVIGLYGVGVGTNAWAAGETVTDCTSRGMYLRSGGNWRVLHSTFTRNTGSASTQGALVNTDTGGAPGSTFDGANNLFLDNTIDVNFSSSSIRAASTMANFLFGESPEIRWGSTYTTGVAWDSATAVATGMIDGDPLLVNATAGDYRLTESSPARDAGSGTLLSELEIEFELIFGFALNFSDPLGTVVDGVTPDIGSFQFAEETPDPDPPSNLVATATHGSLITVTFDDDADNESAFQLERSAVGSGSGFTLLTTLAPSSGTDGSLEYLDGSVSPGQTWYYRARAINTGFSTYTAEDSATTPSVTLGTVPPPANVFFAQ